MLRVIMFALAVVVLLGCSLVWPTAQRNLFGPREGDDEEGR